MKPQNYISFDALLMDRQWEYPVTEEMAVNMARVWFRVNQLIAEYPAQLAPPLVSSGYRPGKYNTLAHGAAKSTHLTCEAVDVADPGNKLDEWLDQNPSKLVDSNLWREDPASTSGWVHLDIRPRPTRTFKV